MDTPTSNAPKPPVERVRISCPGCGRNDWVSWPAGRDTFAWKCFNCEKEFTLRKPGGGH